MGLAKKGLNILQDAAGDATALQHECFCVASDFDRGAKRARLDRLPDLECEEERWTT